MKNQKSNRNRVLFSFFFCVLAVSHAQAQSLPPACQQYFRTIDICGADLVRLTELREPGSVGELKKSLDMKPSIAILKKGVSEGHAQKVAEYCATSDARDRFMATINNIVGPLSMLGGMSQRCYDAVAAIR
ncbi:hypothetical protein [Pandoraea apista]|uniref:hypothetical protein n=1 Tax=Pandoraea apista TaxID=93218 RepID=UPI000657BABE|nr:hypothetical protein [Pandoraea apista]ALS65190.1 hypothetical protein AT395_09470 [Pandoraea apista]RRW90334.1 hypothetical protein EGJ54_22675 [Pandoraea apista]RRX00095.1 hypothetical protein EGJ56_20810 [Pandoraea apista]CFB65622.1 hypothetical protein LMG16407_04972 [Pandoraea apista]